MTRPTPVTLLSGWLGSGKTTFLNHLLDAAQRDGRRIAVLQNEFGDAGLDGSLLAGSVAGLYELSSGCICCTVHDDFMAVIEEILAMENRPDAIVVETTGVADPSVPLVSLLQHPAYEETFKLDGVITLVDAEDVERARREHPEVALQIAVADLLLINKIDLAESVQIAAIRRDLATMNPAAKIVEVVQAEISQLHLNPLDLGGFDPGRIDVAAGLKSEIGKHSEGVGAVSFVTDQPIDADRLHGVLEEIFAENGEAILRAKGIFAVAGVENRLVLQGVRDRYSWQYRATGGDRTISRAVIIGRDLPEREIREAFEKSITRT